MPIIYCPGYMTKEEAARKMRVQPRIINLRINKKTLHPTIIDGVTFIHDTSQPVALPPGVVFSELQWVRNFARDNHFIADRIYEQIILGKITGVIIGNRIFVKRDETALLTFAAIARKAGKKQVFY